MKKQEKKQKIIIELYSVGLSVLGLRWIQKNWISLGVI